MKKRLLASSAALLLLSSSVLLPAPPVKATETSPPISLLALTDPSSVYTYAIPVNNAWDYSVWSHYENGKRVGSLNHARNSFLLLHEVVVLDNQTTMFHFTSDVISGWVHVNGLFQGARPGGMEVQPVANAWDYGIWTHFSGGSFVANLNSYRGKTLTIKHKTGDNKWAFIKDGTRDLGWVSMNGLAAISMTSYKAFPVANAWDYSVWSLPTNGIRLGSLNHARNQELTITDEMVVGGIPMVYFSSNVMSGWVAKAAIQTGVTTINETLTPVPDAWNYGIWSNYQGGTRLDSLNSYRGQQLTAIAETSSGWVQIKHGDTIIGWVHRSGLQELYAFEPYTGVPVANAWDYSVWSQHTNGSRLGSMNDYANRLVEVIAESPDGSVVQFKVNGTVIGWVSPWAIVEGGTPVEDDKEVVEETTTEEIPYAVQWTTDDNLPLGEQVVMQAGVPGEKRIVEKVTYVDGVETGREFVSETIIVEPIDEIVATGTKEPEASNVKVEWIHIDKTEVNPGESVKFEVMLIDAEAEVVDLRVALYNPAGTFDLIPLTKVSDTYYELAWPVAADEMPGLWQIWWLEYTDAEGNTFNSVPIEPSDTVDFEFTVLDPNAVPEEPAAEAESFQLTPAVPEDAVEEPAEEVFEAEESIENAMTEEDVTDSAAGE